MGIDQSDLLQKDVKRFQQMFNKNFSLFQRINYDIFGQVDLYQNKNTRKLQVIIKSMTFTYQQQIEKIMKNLRKRIIKPIPNLLNIYHLQQTKITNLFCGSQSILRIYVQYIQKSLKKEINKRRISKKNFTQMQLWKIMISLINAIKYLHEQQIFHGQIKLDNIMIDSDYHLKLIQRSLLNSLNWQIQASSEKITLTKGKGILFSPCLLKCMYHQKTQIASYDPFKADIWAIGLIILQCASLQPSQNFYDYQKFEVKISQISLCIYNIRKYVSSVFANILQKMLKQQDQQRFTASQIYDLIQKTSNKKMQEHNMTLNQSFLNQTIRNFK